MSLEALDQLESRVGEAAERLETLRDSQAALEARVGELEGELAAARAAAAISGVDGGAAAWQAERAELERRLARLVARLEKLLAG